LDRLTRPRHPLVLAALAVVLSLPALGLGFQLDDHFLRVALTRPAPDPEWARSPFDVFAFFTGDARFTRHVRDAGSVPWWVADELKLAFWRPLSGLTHGLDFHLWPTSPALMHAHSLAWLGACVALCAVLFRQLALPPAAAALAALVFAIDDAHGTPAAWIANRNALVGTAFSLLCLITHHRWRAQGWRAGALLAPLALLLALLGGEIAVATGGYLLGYALFVDRASPRTRLLSLLPCAGLGLAWALAYRTLGYGTAASTLYVDPGRDPFRFLAALVDRAPLLLFGQWALPADLNGMFSVHAQRVFWVVSLAAAALVAAGLLPLLRREPLARFLGLGMVLSLVPASATFPSNRLLMLAGVGGAGLAGWWMAEAARDGRRFLLAGLGAIHLVLAPFGLLGAAAGVRLLGEVPTRAAATLPKEPGLAAQHLVIVHAPSAFLASQSLLEHALGGGPAPRRAHVLGSGRMPVLVSRTDERTLVLEADGGYLPVAGSVGRDGAPPAPVDQHHVLGIFDRLYRDRGFEAGFRVEMAGLGVHVQAVTTDGWPLAVAFRLDQPLEDATYRWLQWRDGGYVPFPVPPVGASVRLPSPEAWPAP
jgi:hypothetical protein